MIKETASFAHRVARPANAAVFWILIAAQSLPTSARAESAGIGPGSSTSAAEASPDVRGPQTPSIAFGGLRQSWEDDYASLKAALSKRDNRYALLRTGEQRTDVAHIQSLLWESDRTPADVALRRTAALLAAPEEHAPGARSRGPGKAIGGRPVQEHRGGG